MFVSLSLDRSTSAVHLQTFATCSKGGERNRGKQVCLLCLQRTWPSLGKAPFGQPRTDHCRSPNQKVLYWKSGLPSCELPTVPRKWSKLSESADRQDLRWDTGQPPRVLSGPGRRGWRRGGSLRKLWRQSGLWRRSSFWNGRVFDHLGSSRSTHPTAGIQWTGDGAMEMFSADTPHDVCTLTTSGPLHLAQPGCETRWRVKWGGRGRWKGRRSWWARAWSWTPAAHASFSRWRYIP